MCAAVISAMHRNLVTFSHTSLGLSVTTAHQSAVLLTLEAGLALRNC